MENPELGNEKKGVLGNRKGKKVGGLGFSDLSILYKSGRIIACNDPTGIDIKNSMNTMITPERNKIHKGYFVPSHRLNSTRKFNHLPSR